MKRTFSLLVVALIVALATTNVFAHGHGYRRTTYSICNVQNCAKTWAHTHNNKTYAAHYNGDGHSHHNYGGYHH